MPNAVAYQKLIEELPMGVQLLAVSKTKSVPEILELYRLGQRDFGENKVQELLIKIKKLPSDIRWHLIGNLQKNKVNKIVGSVELIQSVNSLLLAEKIDQRARLIGKTQKVLIQVNTANEENKSGFCKNKIEAIFEALIRLKSISIEGLMAIGAHVKDENLIRKSFKDLKELRNLLHVRFSLSLEILSMGMSNDYLLAIDEGSTLIRVGSLLFGKRDYKKVLP